MFSIVIDQCKVGRNVSLALAGDFHLWTESFTFILAEVISILERAHGSIEPAPGRNNMKTQSIGVVGLGKVGLPLALVMARHFDVKGVDINKAVVRRVLERQGFSETNVNEYLERHGGQLDVSTDFEITAPCNVVFVCVQTPSTSEGKFSLNHVVSAIGRLSELLHRKSQILVIVSTINPTDMKEGIVPYLRRLGILERTKGVCYNPAMITLGNAIHGFEQPDYVLIGESNRAAGAKLENVWRQVVPGDTPIIRGSITDIETAKFALNLALVNKIAFINTVTEFCEAAGADIDFIANIMKLEPRIAGKKMFKGGLGFGGPCFPRDVVAFKKACEKLGVAYRLCDAIQHVNNEQVVRSLEIVESLRRKRVGMLGVTYKPNTSLVVESQALQIAQGLQERGHEVTVYDPLGMENAKRQLKGVNFATNMKQCILKNEIVFIGVPWPEFFKLEARDFRGNQIVIDPWRVLRDKELPCKYIPYGLEWR